MIGDMPHSDDTTGGSETAEDPSSRQTQALGFWDRLKWAFFGGSLPQMDSSEFSRPEGEEIIPGIWNLRQLRVEDVMVPKADIKSVPVTITKEDLVHVFRDCLLYTSPSPRDRG